jgi:hypothetical protein
VILFLRMNKDSAHRLKQGYKVFEKRVSQGGFRRKQVKGLRELFNKCIYRARRLN